MIGLLTISVIFAATSTTVQSLFVKKDLDIAHLIRPHWRFEGWCSRRPLTQRYKGLFVHQRSLNRMVNQRVITDVFRIKNVKFQYSFPGICPKPAPLKAFTESRLEPLPECTPFTNPDLPPVHLPLKPRKVFRKTLPSNNFCCQTKFGIGAPETVQSIYDPTVEYRVVHNPPYYQVIHAGTCGNRLGSPCNRHGTCQEESRLQTIQVNIGGKEVFLPVSVPNHCYCQYT